MNPTRVPDTQRLCLSCGFCCNGALFRDVELQAGDDARQLARLGLTLERLRRKTRLAQPCAALCAGNRCRFYAHRPQHCRQFECALFQSVAAGHVPLAGALRVIQSARRQLDRVNRLLDRLGCDRKDLPLLARFQRTNRRLERSGASGPDLHRLAELSQAFHKMQLLLRRKFFPPP